MKTGAQNWPRRGDRIGVRVRGRGEFEELRFRNCLADGLCGEPHGYGFDGPARSTARKNPREMMKEKSNQKAGRWLR